MSLTPSHRPIETFLSLMVPVFTSITVFPDMPASTSSQSLANSSVFALGGFILLLLLRSDVPESQNPPCGVLTAD